MKISEMMTHEEVMSILFKDEAFRKSHDALGPEYDLISAKIEKRIAKERAKKLLANKIEKRPKILHRRKMKKVLDHRVAVKAV